MDILDTRARINSKGTHVVCGMQDCSSRMATVGRISPEEVAEAQAKGEVLLPVIQFLAGWAPRRDRVWAFSEHARKREDDGKSPKTRRYPKGDGIAGDNDLFDFLPAGAKCPKPKCGMINVLTVANIGVHRIVRVPPKNPTGLPK